MRGASVNPEEGVRGHRRTSRGETDAPVNAIWVYVAYVRVWDGAGRDRGGWERSMSWQFERRTRQEWAALCKVLVYLN